MTGRRNREENKALFWRKRRASAPQIVFRPEQPADAAAVDALFAVTFPNGPEPLLIEALRDADPGRVAVVAEAAGEIFGAVVFASAQIDGPLRALDGLAIAPMAVAPAARGRGLGRALTEAGFAAARESGAPFVLVIGAAKFFAQFGCEPAARWHVAPPSSDITPEGFHIRVFDPARMAGVGGIARYHPAFVVLT